MGWEVIRQECPEDPGRSRLWDSNAYHVLIRNMVRVKCMNLFIPMYPSFNTIVIFSEISRVYNSIKFNASFVLLTCLTFFRGHEQLKDYS